MIDDWVYNAVSATDYDSLTKDTDYSSSYSLSGIPGVRGIQAMSREAGMLGIQGLVEPLMVIGGAIQLITGAYRTMETLKSMIDAATAEQEAAAAIETAAIVGDPITLAAYGWVVALAAGSAAAVAGGFMFAEGDFHLPAVDISNEAGRNQAASQVREAAGRDQTESQVRDALWGVAGIGAGMQQLFGRR